MFKKTKISTVINYSKRSFATYPSEIRKYPTQTITNTQREFYFKHGYLVLPGFLSTEWLEKLNTVTEEFIELSKKYNKEKVLPLAHFLFIFLVFEIHKNVTWNQISA